MDSPQPVVTVFRSRVRPEAVDEYGALAQLMDERARAMPGLLDLKTFAADDGERVTIAVFDTWEHHGAWREDPQHRRAQELGRARFYSEYSIAVCQQHRRLVFARDPDDEPAGGHDPR